MIRVQIPQTAPKAVVSLTRALKEARTILLVNAADALPLLSPRLDRQSGSQTDPQAEPRQSVVLTQMSMLSEAMLRSVKPDAVIAPLIAPDFDIVDLGCLLEDLGYCGDLYALTRPLPRAELVIREMGASCPRLKVKLLEVG